MFYRGHSWLVYAIWLTLIGAFCFALYERNWQMGFVAISTLVASMVPAFVADRYELRLPVAFFAGLVLFLFATLFLGEAFDFYEKIWWWDVVLHATSAIGFGLVGVIIALVMFEGDRYAAPPWAIGLIGFTFAVTIGVLWEVFEYFMDISLGLSMQKSGLDDTMLDMIANAGGGLVSAWAGYAYLRGRDKSGLSGMISEFVRGNKWYFPKSDNKKRR
ncbi:MAG: hypothetical protein GY945_08205 [Rhodobacteraceae bacterium]|nr:hypothetical protein [Paracoccaceae bacterium]